MGLLSHIVPRQAWREIALLVIASGLAGAAAPVSEYQVKAVFLFNFAQFVEWPTSAFPRPNAPFVIGVLGQDPFGVNLDEVVRGETVNKRPLAVARFHDISEVHDCQILFIPSAELAHLDQILTALKGRSVLTVTDANDPSQRGVMIALVTQDSRIRLRIDLQAARAGNLTISSKLLRPAEIVGAARS
jgi:YfiR/HmsC-like